MSQTPIADQIREIGARADLIRTELHVLEAETADEQQKSNLSAVARVVQEQVAGLEEQHRSFVRLRSHNLANGNAELGRLFAAVRSLRTFLDQVVSRFNLEL